MLDFVIEFFNNKTNESHTLSINSVSYTKTDESELVIVVFNQQIYKDSAAMQKDIDKVADLCALPSDSPDWTVNCDNEYNHCAFSELNLNGYGSPKCDECRIFKLLLKNL